MTLKKVKPAFLSVLLVGMVLLQGCYSFTGVSGSNPETKTISVDFFQNQASIVAPTLSQVFTEKLKLKCISQTNLKLSQEPGDVQFSGRITGYSITPVSLQSQGNPTATQSRLKIDVVVKYVNTKDPKLSYEQTFSQFADFDSTQTLSAVEAQLIEQITDLLVQEIFNKAFINW